MGREGIQNIRLERGEKGIEIVFDAYCESCKNKGEGRREASNNGSAYYQCGCGKEYRRKYSLQVCLEGKTERFSSVDEIIDLAKHLG